VIGGTVGNATLCGGATVDDGPIDTQPTAITAAKGAPSANNRCFKWSPRLIL